MRGEEVDERIPHRNSRTSIKARTCTTNVQWNDMKESQTTQTQTSERVSCDETATFAKQATVEFNLADSHIKNDSFNHLSVQNEEATASNQYPIKAQEETRRLHKQLFRFENLSGDQLRS